MEEHDRLLYVALTRAEDRLLVCGWAPARPLPETCWYSLIAKGFAALPVREAAFGPPLAPWPGTALLHETPQTVPPRAEPAAVSAPAPASPPWIGAAPDWIAAPPPAEPPRPQPLAPSRPEGVAFGPVPSALSPLAARGAGALRRGRLVHALLQHLPALPAASRAAAARAWLARPGHGLTEGAAEDLAAQVLAVLDHPGLAPLFGPDSRAEVPLSGVIAGMVVGGLVDRLVVRAEEVLVADYKTNRRPPADPAGTPVAYPAPDGRLSQRVARSVSRPDRPRDPGLDRDGPGDGPAGGAVGCPCAEGGRLAGRAGGSRLGEGARAARGPWMAGPDGGEDETTVPGVRLTAPASGRPPGPARQAASSRRSRTFT